MTCSPARLAANKANSLKAKGPVSPEGKARSRSNALKHGLTAKVVRTAEEQDAVARAGAGEGSLAGWIDDEVVVLPLRIHRAHQVEERDRASMRADGCWDEDRSSEAVRVGRGLGRHPDRVVKRLRGSVQGCAWLIERWGWLRVKAGQEGGWTADDQNLASDLRGIPAAFRGQPVDPAAQASQADDAIRGLESLRKNLRPCDAFEQESARLKLDNEASPELRRVIRYEAALQRRLVWFLNQRRIEAGGKAAPRRAAVVAKVATPAPPKAEPRPAPVPPVPLRECDPFDDHDRRLSGLFGSGFQPGMGSVLPISMVPVGSRPRLG